MVFTATSELTTIDCGECGGVYAITEKYRSDRYKTGTFWHCPYCQTSWGYAGNSENAKLRRELAQQRKWKEQAQAQAQRARDERDTAERQKRAARGQVTKIKNRISNGLCPCCRRHFANLQRHIQTKHPKYKAEKK